MDEYQPKSDSGARGYKSVLAKVIKAHEPILVVNEGSTVQRFSCKTCDWMSDEEDVDSQADHIAQAIIDRWAVQPHDKYEEDVIEESISEAWKHLESIPELEDYEMDSSSFWAGAEAGLQIAVYQRISVSPDFPTDSEKTILARDLCETFDPGAWEILSGLEMVEWIKQAERMWAKGYRIPTSEKPQEAI